MSDGPGMAADDCAIGFPLVGVVAFGFNISFLVMERGWKVSSKVGSDSSRPSNKDFCKDNKRIYYKAGILNLQPANVLNTPHTYLDAHSPSSSIENE